MADDVTFYDDIEAYCGRLSYRPGETVALHVSTKTPTYDVVIERWGATREEVWRSPGPIDGGYHAPPDDADANGCGWPVGLDVEVGTGWRSGFYLVTLIAHGAPAGRDVAHAGFVVRPVSPTGAPLLVLATNTWNAYNNWGGCSLYTGGSQVSFRRPFARGLLCRPEVERDDRKARPVRWDEEPDADGFVYQGYRNAHGYPAAIGSSGWFTFERRFVEWAEREGYEFDYAVSSDLDADATALDGYELVVSVGHDEYWSAPQRDVLEAHLRRGGHLASFSGNTMFWQVRIADDGDTMIGHKYSAHLADPVMTSGDPTTMSGMWSDPVVGRPETAILGAGSAWGLYHRFGKATARGVGGFVVYRDDHWLFERTGLRYGDVLGARDGVVGYETLGCRIQFDEYQLPVSAGGDGTPEHLEIVAFCPSSNLRDGEYPASISALSDQGDLDFVAERLFGRVDDDSIRRIRHGNAVIVVVHPFGPDAGEVVTIGTTDWVFGLATDPAVAQVTKNVLDRLCRVERVRRDDGQV
ncbi:MAG: N,N-dimethylformamidase beta subunit family domain-containing protein [Acidimicrobiia bacterium]